RRRPWLGRFHAATWCNRSETTWLPPLVAPQVGKAGPSSPGPVARPDADHGHSVSGEHLGGLDHDRYPCLILPPIRVGVDTEILLREAIDDLVTVFLGQLRDLAADLDVSHRIVGILHHHGDLVATLCQILVLLAS